MRFQLDNPEDSQNRIRAYDTGRIEIAGRLYAETIAVSQADIENDWPVQGIEGLDETHLKRIRKTVAATNAEILILGTGKKQVFPHPKLLAGMAQAVFDQPPIGVEVMDTAAACRTYNILLSEGRKVTALLFPIEE